MSLPEYGQKHISELDLNNNIADEDFLLYESYSTTMAFKMQFGGMVNVLSTKYFATKALNNITVADLKAFCLKLGSPNNPDDGSGVQLRSHANSTQPGLATLSGQLINADAHRIPELQMENLTTEEFQKFCRLLAGVIERADAVGGGLDGLLALRDLSNVTDASYDALRKVIRTRFVQTSANLVIPDTMLNKLVEIELNEDVTRITLPALNMSTDVVRQVILVIKRNGFSIAPNALALNNYVVRNGANNLPGFNNTAPIDNAIELFCEYDPFVDPANPTWNIGFSKIGH